MKLRSRTRKPDESLQELGGDVECLARLAYLDATDNMLKVIIKDQFIDALGDKDLRFQIRQNRPTSLNVALEQALKLESYLLANGHHSGTVREVQLEQETTRCGEELPVNRTAVDTGYLEKLQQCLLEAIQHCAEWTSATSASRNGTPRGTKMKCCRKSQS